MRHRAKPKEVFLSVIYLLLLVAVYLAMDFLLIHYLKHRLFDFLVEFDESNPGVKIVVVLGGLWFFMAFGYNFIQLIAAAVSALILSWFPETYFNGLMSIIISLVNLITLLILLWVGAPYYSFWMVIELLFVSVLVLL